MKMLKKLAALILAATMVLVLFTACGGDGGSTGTRELRIKKLKGIRNFQSKNDRVAAEVQLCNDHSSCRL